MVRIIGSILLFSSILVQAATIDMRITDHAGSPLMQAAIGQPCVLELSMNGMQMIGHEPKIKGLEVFEVSNTGMRIVTVNGRTTAKYTYELRTDKPGVYTVGPATISYQNNHIVSNVLHLTVGEESISEQSTSKRKRSQDAQVMLRLDTDKQKAYVGERIQSRLRLYYTDKDIGLRQFIQQELKGINRKKSRGPYSGTDTVDGVEYDYVELQWDLYPTQAGDLVLPAYGADYERAMERDNLWGGLGRFFGTRVETKRIYSNAVSLNVLSIPAHTKKVDAVGSFSSITLHAQPAAAKQGEGIIISVDITGDGDPDQITFQGLQGVPKDFKFYESKQTVIEPETLDEPYVKRFEYVLQGLKIGSYEIPSQTFHFYDSARKKFKTIQSAPLTLSILPGAAQKKIVVDDDASPLHSTRDILAPLSGAVGFMRVQHEWYIPWLLYISLLLSSLAAVGGLLLGRRYHKRKDARKDKDRYNKAFRVAQTSLQKYKNNKNSVPLYGMFITLFASRMMAPESSLSRETITTKVAKFKFNEQEQQAWNTFFSEISEQAFSGASDNTENSRLWIEAEQWLKILQRFL